MPPASEFLIQVRRSFPDRRASQCGSHQGLRMCTIEQRL